MKIPSKVRIKSRVSYEVVYQDIIKDDVKCLGICDPNKRQIILKIGQSETELRKSYLHELCHAICFEWDIAIPHASIYKLEHALLSFLKFNKLI